MEWVQKLSSSFARAKEGVDPLRRHRLLFIIFCVVVLWGVIFTVGFGVASLFKTE